MFHKLKADLLQHSTAYLLIFLLGGALIMAIACGVFMLSRLIGPAHQAITPAPMVTLALTWTPALADAYHCDQPPMNSAQEISS